MALNINGTTGISGVDGSASTPALQGTDSNTGINFASDTVNINTGGSTRATVDSSGRFLIGTTTGDPYGNRYLTVNSNSGTTAIEVRSATNGDGRIIFTDSTSVDSGAYKGQILYDQTNDYMSFNTNGSNERMRILSTGQLHVGPHSTPFTTTTLLNIQRTNGSLFSLYHDGTDNNTCAVIRHQRASGSDMGTMIQFNNSSGSAVGTIQSGASGTAYNTSSDYRLKENVTAISDGITRLKTLKPSRFNFKINKDITVDGFLAHEVTAVPEAISGTKDGMKAETYYREGDTLPSGKVVGDVKTYSSTEPEYQGIDQSKLVPLLTAALQEAVAKIEVLETKVAALEAG